MGWSLSCPKIDKKQTASESEQNTNKKHAQHMRHTWQHASEKRTTKMPKAKLTQHKQKTCNELAKNMQQTKANKKQTTSKDKQIMQQACNRKDNKQKNTKPAERIR